MYIRVTSTPNSPRKSVKVVESIRNGLKVKQVMLHHVGIATDDAEVAKLKKIGLEFIANEQLRREKESGQLSFLKDTPEERLQAIEAQKTALTSKKAGRKSLRRLVDIAEDHMIKLSKLAEEHRVIDGIHDVGGHVFEQLGYHKLLERKKDRELLRDIILMRIANPGSKYKAQRILAKQFSRIHDLDSIYRMMDKLFPKIDKMKLQTFKKAQDLIPEAIDILFFDCTTLYFESTETDELRRFGYSKDHRFNTTQVVLALATNSDGLPLGYELFEGNKAEVGTLLKCLESWKKNFNIAKVCFVADRAMMSESNLNLLENHGHQYVIAAKLRGMTSALQEEILAEKNYKAALIGNEIGWVGEFSYKKRRLIVSYKSKRAIRDQQQRQQIINKISKTLGTEGDTKKLITNHGVKKFTTTKESVTELDAKKIEADAAWDGLHGVITNITEGNPVEALHRYSCLWKIEESFRLNKHTLAMRPIFHSKTDRIHAHIAICYMAFAILRHIEYRVNLRQKITPSVIIEELMNVESTVFLDTETKRRYRVPGRFSHTASKIYKALDLTKDNHTKEII